MSPVPNPILKASLEAFIVLCASHSPVFTSFYTNLFNTGLRFSELRYIDNFSFIDEFRVLAKTLKGSNDRIIPISELTPDFLASISFQRPLYNRITNSTASYYMECLYTIYPVLHGDKVLTNSLFRHNKAKMLHDAGFSDMQIKNYFGEVSIDNMKNYIYSDLLTPLTI